MDSIYNYFKYASVLAQNDLKFKIHSSSIKTASYFAEKEVSFGVVSALKTEILAIGTCVLIPFISIAGCCYHCVFERDRMSNNLLSKAVRTCVYSAVVAVAFPVLLVLSSCFKGLLGSKK